MSPLEVVEDRIEELENQLDWINNISERFVSMQRRRMVEERLKENIRWRALLKGEILEGENYQ
tara:strand:- start:511 stop:699 length:189 start_codon:yes stop_codon:yes gene_type:complete